MWHERFACTCWRNLARGSSKRIPAAIMDASSPTSGPRQTSDADSQRADVLAYRPAASSGAGSLSSGASKRGAWPRGADSAAGKMPPVVLRMPDLTETDAQPPWQPVIRPIRYRLILAALGLTVVLVAMCYWLLKAEVAPRPEEAPPWEGGRKNWNSGPVKVERPSDGRMSLHQPVPTYKIERLPAVGAEAPGNNPTSLQAGPTVGRPAPTWSDEPVRELPGVARLQDRIDVPATNDTRPDHERTRPSLH